MSETRGDIYLRAACVLCLSELGNDECLGKGERKGKEAYCSKRHLLRRTL